MKKMNMPGALRVKTVLLAGACLAMGCSGESGAKKGEVIQSAAADTLGVTAKDSTNLPAADSTNLSKTADSTHTFGTILPNKRIIAYYGNPLSKRMGILGELPPDKMLARLDQEVEAWEKADP